MVPRLRAHPTLLGRVTAASALIAVAFALALGWLTSRQVTAAAEREAVASTALAADMLLGPYLVKGDFIYPLWAARLDDLDRLIGRHLRGQGIMHVRLWNRIGTVVYSTDRRSVGLRSAGAPELAATLAGRILARIGPSPAGIQGEGGGSGDVLAVFAPVRLAGMTQPEGVYEVHRDPAPLLAHVRAIRLRVWVLVLVGTAVLYGSLFGLVRRASDTLLAQQQALRQAFEGTVQSLAAAVDAKDAYTGDHSSRVSRYAEAIACALGLPQEDIEVVRLASYLHDLGKIGIPDRVLLKTGVLDERDWVAVRGHSLIGYEILRPVPIDERVKLAVRHTHERWDGAGYPDGLRGEAIPVHARILMVADTFEAMTSDRPYRTALDVAAAVAELRRHCGSQFDPRVVEAFLATLEQDPVAVQTSMSATRARRFASVQPAVE
ncbi:MAG: HD-GYP domain-containing protein [Armatimonadota bacterium]|nr:HD-GYP domain-containing protein [Armatimonadota bacterium]